MPSRNTAVRKQLNCRIDARLIRALRNYARHHDVPLNSLVEVVLADLAGKIRDNQRPFSAVLRRIARDLQNQGHQAELCRRRGGSHTPENQ